MQVEPQDIDATPINIQREAMRQPLRTGEFRDQYNRTTMTHKEPEVKKQYRLKADLLHLSVPEKPAEMNMAPGIGSTTSQQTNKTYIRSHKNSFNGPATTSSKYQTPNMVNTFTKLPEQPMGPNLSIGSTPKLHGREYWSGSSSLQNST